MPEEVLRKRRTAVVKALSLVEGEGRLGVGSGSTMSLFLEELSRATRTKGQRVRVVPSSSQVEVECSKLGLELSSLYDDPRLKIVVDGADEVDIGGNLLKGGGAALTREKILHSSSDKVVIVIEEEKRVQKLGTHHPLPVEVLPFALPHVTAEVRRTFSLEPKVRMLPGKAGPLVTDNGNYILDIPFGQIGNLPGTDVELKSIPGVVETGIFLVRAGFLVVGSDRGPEVLELRGSPVVKAGGSRHDR